MWIRLCTGGAICYWSSGAFGSPVVFKSRSLTSCSRHMTHVLMSACESWLATEYDFPHSSHCDSKTQTSHRCQPSAIVRVIPHFGLFPAFPHFCRNVPHFWLYFEITKIALNRNIFAVRRHLVRKSCAKTSVIASPSY